MIASHFEQQLSVAQIRDISGTDTDGTNLKGIIKKHTSNSHIYGANSFPFIDTINLPP